MHKKRLFVLINIIISGLFAILLYLLIREDDYVMKIVSKSVIIEKIRVNIGNINSNTYIGYVIKYSFGDLLWAYALNFSSYLGFNNINKSTAISLITCFLLELIQNSKYITGKFDIIDLTCMIIGVLLSVAVIKFWEYKSFYSVNY